MPAKFQAEQYLYTAARVRSLEAGLLSGERMRTLAGLADVDEVFTALATLGFTLYKEADGSVAVDETLTERMAAGLTALGGSLPDPTLTCLIQYPYDCHNIKACLKAPHRGMDPAVLLIGTGSLPITTLLEAMKSGDHSVLPAHMAAAVPVAAAAFAKTGDPREIDFIMDAAAFADMGEGVADFAFGRAVLTLRIDSINLQTAWRLLAVADAELRALLFKKAKLPGGSLSEACFSSILSGELTLAAATAGTPYAKLFAGDPTPACFERRAEDLQMDKVREAKYITFGPEIPFAYLFALDTEVKNLRIVLAGKRAGLSTDAILERVRESYV